MAIQQWKLGLGVLLLLLASCQGTTGDSAPPETSATELRATTGESTTTAEAPVSTAPGSEPFVIDLADLEPTETVKPDDVVVDAGWGDAPNQVGLWAEQGFGPCCFDVAGDGTVVICDEQNLRIVAWPPDGDPTVIIAWDWEADGFHPDAVAVDTRNQVYVLGGTRAGGVERIHDLVIVDLAGRVIDRTSTPVRINADLRASGLIVAGGIRLWDDWVNFTNAAGQLLAKPPTTPGWPISDGGTITVDAETQTFTRTWPDGTDTTWDVQAADWAIAIIGPHEDGILVGAYQAIPGLRRIIHLDKSGTATERLRYESRYGPQLGAFGTIRIADGSIYEMWSDDHGIQIVRFDLNN